MLIEHHENAWLILLVFLTSLFSAKKKTVAPATTPAPVHSQMPPPTAEVIEHCVVTKRENAEYGVMPLRAGDYAHRLQDRAHRHRLQEDARDPVTA